MKYTTQKCPTRTALERKPGDPGFLVESIHANHSRAKAERHRQNVQDRAERNADRNRKQVVKSK